jgi:transcriptional regulator with XRE-family HTH domain
MINVKEERTRLAMTQKRLAHVAGIDARTVRKLERGETVSLETRHTVYTALGIPLERTEDDTKVSGVSETPDAKLSNAKIMAGASACYAAAVTILSDAISRKLDIATDLPIKVLVLACLIGTIAHFVLATLDLQAYYTLKYTPKVATKAMLQTVFPFGITMLMPGLFWPHPHGTAILMTAILGNAALFVALVPALQVWINQRADKVTPL